jgi:hypothetical protein
MRNLISRSSITMLLGALALSTLTLAQRADAAVPCCSITAIDTKGGLITIKEKATGATCQYRVADAGALRNLKVGGAVDPNVLPQAQPVQGAAGKAGSSTTCGGYNGPRGGDTRPKECVDSKGNKVACPSKPTTK